MDENLRDIEELFFSNLDGNKESPPQEIWHNLQLQLERDNNLRFKQKYRNLKRATSMLVLLLSAIVLVELFNVSKQKRLVIIPANESNSSIQNDVLLLKISATKKSEKPSLGLTNHNSTKPSLLIDGVADTNGSVTKKQGVLLMISSRNNEPKISTKSRVNFSMRAISSRSALISHKKVNQHYKTNSIKKRGFPAVGNLVKNNMAANQQKWNPVVKVFLPSNDIVSYRMPYGSADSTKDIYKYYPGKLSYMKNIDSFCTIIKVTVNQKKHHRFSFTPFASIDVAWYRLEDDIPGNHATNATTLEREERHELSATIGAIVDYKLGNHWGLRSGVNFAITNITVDPKTIYAQQDDRGDVKFRINTSSGYGYVLPSFNSHPSIGDSLHTTNTIHSLKYIGIPLAATYNFSIDKYDLNLAAGVEANILVKAKLEATIVSGSRNSIETLNNLEGMKRNYFSGIAGAGASYHLTNRLALSITPTIRFALTSINNDTPVKSYPMTFGLAGGLKITL
jgi:hypothetical protein